MSEPGETGGVGVAAGRGVVARAMRGPAFARVEKRGGAGIVGADAGFDVVVGGGAYVFDEAAGVEVVAGFADGIRQAREPRAQGGERDGGAHAAEDGRARFGGNLDDGTTERKES